jgi:hypothetical protein
MGAVSEFQAIRNDVAELLASGGTDEEAAALAVKRGRDLNLLGPRVFVPSLSRRIMRMELRAFLHALADLFASRLEGKRVGDVAENLYSRIGADEWFADYIVSWAKNPDGEPGAFFPQMVGRVWRQSVGTEAERTDCVMVMITPMSDPHALLKEAYEMCHEVLPEGVWSRYGSNVEAHRLLRLKAQVPGRTWGDVAEILLDEREPHLRALGPEVFAERREMERERIEKLMARFWKEYADRFFDELSAESD